MRTRYTERLVRSFLMGVSVVLPISITISALYWLAQLCEALFRSWVPNAWYQPGLGILVGSVVIFCVGLLVQLEPIRRVFATVEAQFFERFPIIRVIYGATRDLLGFVTQTNGKHGKHFHTVVTVTLADGKTKCLGLVTRDDLSALPKGLALPERVLVYFPMSYQIGGYTAIVPKASLEPVDMSVEQAMRFTMTGGVSSEPQK